jgi:prepilin-type N-terminal cleavage/methylation domain-containing protein
MLNMNLSNEKGLTLIELLGVIVILSIVSTILWSVFINGQKASNMTKANVSLQQYAHSVFLALQDAHQLSDIYTLDLEGTPKSHSITITGEDTVTIDHPYIEFSFFKDGIEKKMEQIEINSKTDDLKFEIIFNTIENPTKTFTLKTIFEKKSALTD